MTRTWQLVKPMLASPTTGTGKRRPVSLSSLTGTHVADIKLDGLRAVAYCDGDDVRLVNRSLVEITDKFPDVVEHLRRLAAPCVLDGELVTDDGLFVSIATRGKQVKPADIAASVARHPARFYAFDLLELAGEDTKRQPWDVRRMALESVLRQQERHPRVNVTLTSDDLQRMWENVSQLGLEGLIVKDKTAPYMEGKRSPAWLKYKCTRTLSAVAVGYEPGTGARAHFGAMYLALIDGITPISIGRVGTGFNDKEIVWLKAELDAGRTPVVEIEALNRTASNQLRFPVFKGVRSDLAPTDCGLDQLAQFPAC